MSRNGARRGRRRVVIVGGGFGGLEAARHLRGDDLEVTVVDRHNHLLFQPLIYQVAAGALGSGGWVPPWLGAWFPNLAFAMVGFLMTMRVR